MLLLPFQKSSLVRHGWSRRWDQPLLHSVICDVFLGLISNASIVKMIKFFWTIHQRWKLVVSQSVLESRGSSLGLCDVRNACGSSNSFYIVEEWMKFLEIWRFGCEVFADISMGRALSPLCANILMRHLERHFSNEIDFSCSFYIRHVDDIFAVVRNRNEAF